MLIAYRLFFCRSPPKVMIACCAWVLICFDYYVSLMLGWRERISFCIPMAYGAVAQHAPK